MSDPQINIQQSILEFAYTIDAASILNTQQSLIEFAYQPKSFTSIGNVLPSRDVSNSGSWASEPIYTKVSSDDANSVVSPLTPSGDSFEVGFNNASYFNNDGTVVIKSKITKVDSTNTPTGDGDTINVTMDLLQSGSIIQSFTFSDIDENDIVEYSFIGSNKSLLNNNFDGISIRITANTSSASGIGFERSANVSLLNIGIDGNANNVGGSTPSDSNGQWPYSGMPIIHSINGSDIVYNNNITINYPGKSGGINKNFGIISGEQNSNIGVYFSGILANRLRGRYRY